MPLGVKPTCSLCKTTATTMWRKGENGEVLCNNCGLRLVNPDFEIKDEPGVDIRESRPMMGRSKGSGDSGSHFLGAVRKSARLKPSRYKVQAATKALSTKGKSRRLIFKKNPIKAPSAVATVVTNEYVFHDGMYYQSGDIVSVMDHDGGIYYAQLRGFLQDQYCEKSAVITWLLPTTNSDPEEFDPSTYVLGPEEDLPRKMACFEFVCHAPSDYYKFQGAPYETRPMKPELGYVCTKVGPAIMATSNIADIFGDIEPVPSSAPSVSKPKENKTAKVKEIKKEKK